MTKLGQNEIETMFAKKEYTVEIVEIVDRYVHVKDFYYQYDDAKARLNELVNCDEWNKKDYEINLYRIDTRLLLSNQ
jgi:hypothetical protein